MMNDVYISAGSNIGERDAYLHFAIKQLEQLELFSIESVSSIYETEPIGYVNQRPFLNIVLHGKTEYAPLELLEKLQQIERNGERVRHIRWGPRTIDLDILLYNQETIIMDSLLIPHPRMKERAFVIVPLYEISSQLTIPPDQLSIEQLYEQVTQESGVVKWGTIDHEKSIERI